MAELPTKEEIEKRMTAHLEHRGNSDTVHLLWKGYLAALMDWGILRPDDYHDLNDLLNDVGEEERRELFLGVSGE
jgi:hypothetical protein